MTINRQDLAVAAILVAVALFFALNTVFGLFQPALPIGTPGRMGPGFFPIVLSGVLLVIGVAIAVRAANTVPQALNRVPWRGIVVILLVPVIFGLTVRGLGLIAATFLVAFVSSFASRRMTPLIAVALSAGLTLFCVLVFHFGLHVPIPLVGSWLGGPY